MKITKQQHDDLLKKIELTNGLFENLDKLVNNIFKTIASIEHGANKLPKWYGAFDLVRDVHIGKIQGSEVFKKVFIEWEHCNIDILEPSRLQEKIQDYLDYCEIIDDRFDYYSDDFRKLRLQVFLRDGEVCARCEAKPKEGISLTVDHIKPVSKYPELALDINNLQVLCWKCNQEKSNKHCTDYRSKNGKKK